MSSSEIAGGVRLDLVGMARGEGLLHEPADIAAGGGIRACLFE